MNLFFVKISAIILLFMAAGCSLPWVKTSQKAENEIKPELIEEPAPIIKEAHNLVPKNDVVSDSPSPHPSAAPEIKPEPDANLETNQMNEEDLLLKEALDWFQRSQELWRKRDSAGAVAALDEAYRQILRVDPKGIQTLGDEKERIRLMICRRMLEIHATRHTSTEGSEKAIPLVLNRHVEREIQLFKGQERKFFLEGYKRSGRYRPMIVAALEKAGLPRELSWLPLIESGFRADAFSSARALGLWQFIPSTGYKFGLKRDRWLDERMDAQKSTHAAIAYLKELHDIFGDWCTVLAAYNCGEGRVLEVIRTQRVNYLDDFWDLFVKLPLETARYVPRFIAALLIINDPKRFGFHLEDPPEPLIYEEAQISKQALLKDIAKVLAVPGDSIESLNPELRLKATPPVPYRLRVPEGKGELLLSKLDEIPVSRVSPKTYTIHQVQRGETLLQLAGRYRTSVQAIAEANQIMGKHVLRVGQKLKILTTITTGKEIGQDAQPAPAVKPVSSRYRVKKGDTLSNIAQHYKTKPQEIMRLNHLESTRLRIDQEILLPPPKILNVAGKSKSNSRKSSQQYGFD